MGTLPYDLPESKEAVSSTVSGEVREREGERGSDTGSASYQMREKFQDTLEFLSQFGALGESICKAINKSFLN